ncbi:MAG TPA: hypothetical protein EYN96_06080 [Candidatus Hydrogenedentes bacterium]|nr:hypothetical protein [Candidatus Hydrogenedentota bacterium]
MTAPKNDTPNPSVILNTLHIFTLSTLVFAFPLYSFLMANPSYFVTNDIWPGTIFFFAFMLTITLPLILTAPVLLMGPIRKSLHWKMHLCLVAFLITLSFLPFVRRLEFLPPYPIIIITIILAILAARQYATNSFIYYGLSFLSPLIILFPLQFLFNDDIAQILDQNKSIPSQETKINTPEPPTIVMVVFDEFPLIDLLNAEGNIDAKRFPNFAAFSNNATWYANATTVHDYTLKAVPAILSGNYPVPGPVIPIRQNYPDTLFTLLENHYEIHSLEAITKLAHDTRYGKYQVQGTRILDLLLKDIYVMYLHATLPKKLATEIEPMEDGLWGGFMKYKRSEGERGRVKRMHNWFVQQNDIMVHNSKSLQIREYISDIDNYPPKTFHLMHILIPHAPYMFLPSGRTYNHRDYDYSRKVENPEDVILYEEHSRQAHLLQVGFADTVLGNLIDKLKTSGLFNNSIIALVADHGVNFKIGHKNRTLSQNNIGSVGFIPLFIRFPGQQQGIVDRTNVQTIDITPTITNALDMEGGHDMEGRSLIDPNAQIPKLKKLVNRKDSIFKFDEEEYTAIRKNELDYYTQTFSLDDPDATLYHHGPGLKWIGKTLEQLKAKSIPAAFDCPGLENLKSVDLSDDFIPVLLNGSISTEDSSPLDQRTVVACVNGIAHGITQPFQTEDGPAFQLLLSDQIFRNGSNDIEFFLMPLP